MDKEKPGATGILLEGHPDPEFDGVFRLIIASAGEDNNARSKMLQWATHTCSCCAANIRVPMPRWQRLKRFRVLTLEPLSYAARSWLQIAVATVLMRPRPWVRRPGGTRAC